MRSQLKFPRRARILCERMAAGETLEAICKDKDMPQVKTVFRWLVLSAEFRLRYARARRLLADRLVNQVVHLADSLEEAANPAELRRQRIRIDARKWAVSQLADQAFGEAVEADAMADRPSPRFTFRAAGAEHQ